MLTHVDILNLMARFTYKPNVEFEVIDGSLHIIEDEPYQPSVAIKAVMWCFDSRLAYPPARQLQGASVNTIVNTAVMVYNPDGLRHQFNFAPVRVAHLSPVPDMALQSEKMFWFWLRRVVIGDLEDHEMDEWFKIDGEVVNNPHQKG